MAEEQDQHAVPADNKRRRGSTEPDPNQEQRTGGEGQKLGKSTQQEDRK